MVQSIIVLLLLISTAAAEECIKYGAPINLRGTLLIKDEAGYNQFIALKLDRPICTAVDPKNAANPGLQYEKPHSGVQVIQAGIYGSDAASNTLRDRLDRLVGQKALVKGSLFYAHTGYHRTVVQLSMEAVDPLDAAGRQALQLKIIESKPKNVAAYDVTVNAGPQLILEARETASGTPLLPSDLYVSHQMTGGEVLYVDCRDGYERKHIRSNQKGYKSCSDDDLCGISAFPAKPVILKFRCTKKLSNQRTTGK
jgi:hypothetical protein